MYKILLIDVESNDVIGVYTQDTKAQNLRAFSRLKKEFKHDIYSVKNLGKEVG